MLRIAIGLILIGVGIYFAWESHSVLTGDTLELAVLFCPYGELTSSDVSNLFHSPAANFAYLIGADSPGDMHTYLTVMRVVGIMIAIVGGYMVFTRGREIYLD